MFRRLTFVTKHISYHTPQKRDRPYRLQIIPAHLCGLLTVIPDHHATYVDHAVIIFLVRFPVSIVIAELGQLQSSDYDQCYKKFNAN